MHCNPPRRAAQHVTYRKVESTNQLVLYVVENGSLEWSIDWNGIVARLLGGRQLSKCRDGSESQASVGGFFYNSNGDRTTLYLQRGKQLVSIRLRYGGQEEERERKRKRNYLVIWTHMGDRLPVWYSASDTPAGLLV